jgi:cytochrome c oxidase cbb3-type subunit 3
MTFVVSFGTSGRIAPVFFVAALLAACSGSGDTGGQVASADLAALRTQSMAYDGSVASELRKDPAALALGNALFAAHCASCHGADASGARGVTNLQAGRFNYGADEAAVRTTIVSGRVSKMPQMGRTLGEVELGQLVAYVESLAGNVELSDYEVRGQQLYQENCIACHSEDGSGNTELGVPNLRDDHWIHGTSMMNKRLVITRGVESVCPPHGDVLNQTEVELMTAYVLSLYTT